MNGKRLQAELWETQMWLMLILAFLMLHFSSDAIVHDLGLGLCGYSFMTFIGSVVKIAQARSEEEAR